MIRLIYDSDGWTDDTEFYVFNEQLIMRSSNSGLFIKIKEPLNKALNKLNDYLDLEVIDEFGHAYFDGDGEPEKIDEQDLYDWYGIEDVEDIEWEEYDKVDDWLDELGDWKYLE